MAGRDYVPALNGLRGLAISLVMASHALLGQPHLQGGFIGVDLFFVLSGFLITSILVREYDRRQRIDLKRFYARRVLRLAPALLVLLLTVTLVGWLFFTPERARENAIDGLITLFYAANWARALDIHPPRLLGHAWSLSVEEQFYLLWPLLLIALLRLVRSRWRIVALIGGGAAASLLWRLWMAAHGATVARLYNGLDTRADCLLVGCAMGVVLASDLVSEPARAALPARLRMLAPAFTVILLLIFWFGDWKSMAFYHWVFAVVEVLASLLILQIFLVERSLTKAILSWAPLVWLGTLSYGLYLWHFPVYAMLREDGRGYRGMVAGTALTFAIAMVSYYGMEKPALELKKRLASP